MLEITLHHLLHFLTKGISWAVQTTDPRGVHTAPGSIPLRLQFPVNKAS